MAKILIAEDELLIAEVLSEWLQKDGHETLIVSTAEDVVTQFPRFDLTLMDLTLKGPNGLQSISLMYGRIPIIVLTAHSDPATIARVENSLGVFSYLVKPVCESTLRATVRVVLVVSKVGLRFRPTSGTAFERLEQLILQLEKHGES